MADTQHIKEGITFHFFVHAIFVALLGAVGFVPIIPSFFRVVGIVLLALAILLLSESRTGSSKKPIKQVSKQKTQASH